MQRHCRDIIKTLRRAHPKIEVKVLRQRVHTILEVSHGVRTIRVAVASSPRDETHAVRNTCAEVCKKLNLERPIP